MNKIQPNENEVLIVVPMYNEKLLNIDVVKIADIFKQLYCDVPPNEVPDMVNQIRNQFISSFPDTAPSTQLKDGIYVLDAFETLSKLLQPN
jgi:hypothetical protein